MKYAVFNSIGEISRIITCPAKMAKYQAANGEEIIMLGKSESVSDTTHYVDISSGDVRKKLPYQYSVETNGLTLLIANTPYGTRVSVLGESVISDGGETAITFDVPGAYMVRIHGKVEYIDEVTRVVING